jgi:hypothetical protein
MKTSRRRRQIKRTSCCLMYCKAGKFEKSY